MKKGKLKVSINGKLKDTFEMNQSELNQALTEILELIDHTCRAIDSIKESSNKGSLNDFKTRLSTLENTERELKEMGAEFDSELKPYQF
jgi:hypothetical protein